MHIQISKSDSDGLQAISFEKYIKMDKKNIYSLYIEFVDRCIEKFFSKDSILLYDIRILSVNASNVDSMKYFVSDTIIYLDLSRNNINEIDISNIPKIQFLKLSKNNISKLISIYTLTELQLSHNNLSKLENLSFPNLVLLDLSYNKIEYIKNIELPICKYVWLNNNKLKRFKISLPKCKFLQLDYNNIKQLSTKNIPCLSHLCIGYTKITSIRRIIGPNLRCIYTGNQMDDPIYLLKNPSCSLIDATSKITHLRQTNYKILFPKQYKILKASNILADIKNIILDHLEEIYYQQIVARVRNNNTINQYIKNFF